MRILVTGSAGHLGEALVRTLESSGHETVGLDIKDSPFSRRDLEQLRTDPAYIVRRIAPDYEAEYQRRGWSMAPSIDRVYVNDLARAELGWHPRYDFESCIRRLRAAEDYRSPLALAVGSKGYHSRIFTDGPYPV
jgi:nucleoside-diphosphate-sugar epimerase